MSPLRLLLPKLPTCPYCDTVYRRSDVGRLKLKKEETCYHCGKKFDISRKKWLILAAELFLLCVGVNILIYSLIDTAVLIAAFICNIIILIIGLILIPYYLIFLKKDRKNKKGERS